MQLQPNGYRAVFFDLDGTLRLNDPPALDTFYRIAAELGYETDTEQRRIGERWVNEYWAESELLKQDTQRFGHHKENLAFWENHASRHLRRIGASEEQADLIAGVLTKRMHQEYQPSDLVPRSVFPTLTALKETGYRLGLVSNRSLPMNELVDELGLSEHFELILAAGDVGWYKPDPRLLEYAAEQLDTDPKASIYVGDNYHADVLGARAAAMTPVLFDPRDIYLDADCLVIKDISEVGHKVLNVSAELIEK